MQKPIEPNPLTRSSALEPAVLHLPSLLQLGFSLLGAVLLWGFAFIFAWLGLNERFSSSDTPVKNLQPFLLVAGLALSGFLLLPSAGYALVRLAGWSFQIHPGIKRFYKPAGFILLLPFILLLGRWVSQQSTAWLFLPFIHVLAIGVPVLWIAHLGMTGLSSSSPQRRWGVFGSGLALAPALILAAETLALVGLILLAAIWISSSPTLANEILTLAGNLRNGLLSPEEMFYKFKPYLTQPTIIFIILAYGALVIPLIEEFLKPIGVWLLAGKSLSPAEGFTAGLLSGAGYALFESLIISISSDEWLFLILARLGTGIIHILTAGLTGWALASAWKQRHFLQLGVTFLVAVFIHAAWNGFTIFFALWTNLPPGQSSVHFTIARLGIIAPFVLATLTIGALVLLLISNHTLRAQMTMSTLAETGNI